MNIVLIGTIAAGKSTIGKAISEMSQFKFVDTDDLIQERIKLVYPSLFSYAHAFDREEGRIVDELVAQDFLVISTGALMVSHPRVIEKFRKNGVIICLQPSVETVISRMKKDKRTFLVRDNQTYEEAVKEDYQTHIEDYWNYDYSFDVSDDETPQEYARKILAIPEIVSLQESCLE